MTLAAALKRNSMEDTTATTDFKALVSWEDAINLYLTKESPNA
jgi:hypothetical protein